MKKSHSKLSQNELMCICKEGCCVILGEGGGGGGGGGLYTWGWGNCLKYFKRSGIKNRRVETKNLERGGQARW